MPRDPFHPAVPAGQQQIEDLPVECSVRAVIERGGVDRIEVLVDGHAYDLTAELAEDIPAIRDWLIEWETSDGP